MTEPGLLQGHHLITRLTNNNGNYTFDASVNLNFDNWSSTDSFYGLALIGTDSVRSSVPLSDNDGRSNAVLSGPAIFSVSVDGGDIKTISVEPSTAVSEGGQRTIRDLVKEVDEAIAVAYGRTRVDGLFSPEDLAALPVARSG